MQLSALFTLIQQRCSSTALALNPLFYSPHPGVDAVPALPATDVHSEQLHDVHPLPRGATQPPGAAG